MSVILRRPMFRGGSANEGIMSVPRKGYAEDGYVKPGYEEYDQDYGEDVQVRDTSQDFKPTEKSSLDLGFSGGRSLSDDIQRLGIMKRLQDIEKINTFEQGENVEFEKLRRRILGKRIDPLGKFLLNFGQQFASTKPVGKGFSGMLATAAKAAEKPLDTFFKDEDTEDLIKLKLLKATKDAKETENIKVAKTRAAEKGTKWTDEFMKIKALGKGGSDFLKSKSPEALIEDGMRDFKKNPDIQPGFSSIKSDNKTVYNLIDYVESKSKNYREDENVGGLLLSNDLDLAAFRKNPDQINIDPRTGLEKYETNKIYFNPINRVGYLYQGNGKFVKSNYRY